MIVIKEMNLTDFKPREEACVTLKRLKENPSHLMELQCYIEEMYPEGINDGELNDLLAYNKELIAEYLGYNNADHFFGYEDENGESLI